MFSTEGNPFCFGFPVETIRSRRHKRIRPSKTSGPIRSEELNFNLNFLNLLKKRLRFQFEQSTLIKYNNYLKAHSDDV